VTSTGTRSKSWRAAPGIPSFDVARRAILATHAAGEGGPSGREQDPGHVLIGAGRRAFEAAARLPFADAGLGGARLRGAGMFGYVATIAVISAVVLALPVLAVAQCGVGGIDASSCSHVSRSSRRRTPRWCSSTATSPISSAQSAARSGASRRGAVELAAALVVVPMLLTTRAAIEAQIEHLEVHHLAGPEDDCCFALLSDGWIPLRSARQVTRRC